VVLGFSSMSAEADGKALTTLLVKPLYRDTIINGKLFGAIGLFFCIFWFMAAMYLSGLFLVLGGPISAQLSNFMEFLPLAFLLYMLCSIFLFSLSMLMCIMFKEQSFALFMGFLSWILLFYVMGNRGLAGYIVDFFHLDQSTSLLVGGLWPYNLISTILGDTINGRTISFALSNNVMFISILSLYCFVTLVAAYISFIRRDVS
jgi:ABC-2 type transport system permease protein